MDELWLNWAVELQSLAQAGLTYGKDVYDRERYEGSGRSPPRWWPTGRTSPWRR